MGVFQQPIKPITGFVLLTLAVLAVGAYWEVKGNDFVNHDDPSYITENPLVNAGFDWKRAVRAFTSQHSYNWHPLTWLSHMLDVELYGLHAGGHHWTNLLMHTANTLLLFVLFRTLTGCLWRSAFVAAIFAIHPLHVESVAWASERKDVLSTLFWILSLLAYATYSRAPGKKNYSLALLLFALGLMAKPMVVTLPFVMLLMDYWPLGRFREESERRKSDSKAWIHLCKEKAPFLLLSFSGSLLTFIIQEGAGAVVSSLSLETRVANALVAYVLYLWKMMWPLGLACFYPHPGNSLAAWQIMGSLLLLAGITLLVAYARNSRPYLLVGWLWYVGTLVPVIGVVQVGEQAMADRYAYIPLIGVSIAVVWGVSEWMEKRVFLRSLVLPLCGMVLLSFFLLTRAQVRYWKNSISLFEHAVQVTRDNFLAHFHLAGNLEQEGRHTEALQHLREVLRLRPGYQPAHYHMGNVLTQLGRTGEALEHYAKAVEINPLDYRTRNNMGFVLMRQGRWHEAALQFSEALRIHPGDKMARHNLALALKRINEPRP